MQYNIFVCFAFILGDVLALRVSSNDRTLKSDISLEQIVVKRPSEQKNEQICTEPPNTIYNASRPDGFGEQYVDQMLAVAFSRSCNGCYNFQGFNFFRSKYGTHDQFDATSFVGLKSDADCRGNHTFTIRGHPKKWRRFVDRLFSKQIRDELRASYWSNAKIDRDSDCEIVFHDRRGDAKKNGNIQIRSSGNQLLQSTIERKFADKKVCIISQGQPEEFGLLQTMPNVKLKLNDSTQEAFHNMVTAPKLVIGHSSLSWAAGILSTAPVYFFPFEKYKDEKHKSVSYNLHGMELSTWIEI